MSSIEKRLESKWTGKIYLGWLYMPDEHEYEKVVISGIELSCIKDIILGIAHLFDGILAKKVSAVLVDINTGTPLDYVWTDWDGKKETLIDLDNETLTRYINNNQYLIGHPNPVLVYKEKLNIIKATIERPEEIHVIDVNDPDLLSMEHAWAPGEFMDMEK